MSPQEHQIRAKQRTEMNWKLPYLPNVCPNDFIGYFQNMIMDIRDVGNIGNLQTLYTVIFHSCKNDNNGIIERFEIFKMASKMAIS